MKTLVYVALLFCLAFVSCKKDPASQNTPPPTTSTPDSDTQPSNAFLKKFQGTIGDDMAIEMVLTKWPDDFLSGHYSYKSQSGKSLELTGEMLTGTNFQLVEYAADDQTGIFKGSIQQDGKITGTWTNADNAKRYDFSLEEVVSTADRDGWTGAWHLNEIWDGGTLLIGNVREDAFDFALNVVRNTHLGSVWGAATLKDGKATFKMSEFDDEPCELTFFHQSDRIEIKQISSSFACGFGARAHANGVFENKVVEKKATLDYVEGEEGIFPSKELHDQFFDLTGQEMYDLFAFNFQRSERNTAHLNGKEISIHNGYVTGLFGVNEGVIAFDKSGKIWAAVLVAENTLDAPPVIRYYSNDEQFKDGLPPFLKSWEERFDSYQVEF